ncbi:hypothetical protein RFI_34523, partial [Reticulomyxa filosa]
HLTFQEWLAAYYLVRCLYQLNETKQHEQLCSILMNQQLTPRYSVMIPFISGILYNNIISNKDPSGSGLLYFWKLLHSSPPQIIPIHQVMLFMHCLDACKADTDSSFLSPQLQICHKSLVDLFESWIIAWIHFDKDNDYAYGKNWRNDYERILDRPLNKVMESHLPNFQYVLHHPDIHFCIINQIKIIQIQFNGLDNRDLIKDRLYLLQYLCISTETSDIVVQCYKQVFKKEIWLCANLLYVISVKWNKRQLDDVIEFFVSELVNEDKYIHERCALLIAKIALKSNKRQLNKVFEFLMDAFESGKITICDKCAHALATISSQLGGKQLDSAFQCLVHIYPSYFHKTKDRNDETDATQFIMKLKEGQLGDIFQYLIGRLSDKKENVYNRGSCAELLGELSMKWNEEQLNDAFNSLKYMLNKDNYGTYRKALETITVKLSGKQLNNAFNYFVNRLNCKGRYIYDDLLERIAQRLDEKQVDIALNYFMDKLNDKNTHQDIRLKYIQLINITSNKCNEQQLNKAFDSSMDIFTDKNDNAYVRKECAELLGTIAVNLNGKYFDDTFKCLTNGLKDSDSSVRKSCVKSLVILSKKWNNKQLDITVQCLIDGFQNINGYHCGTSCRLLEEIAMKLNEIQIDSVLTCLINGLKGNDEKLYAESIGHVSMKLNKKQLDDVFECLNGLKDENGCIRALCRNSLETISTKLDDRQLDRVVSAFIHGLKDKYKWDRKSCARPLGIIATKASEKRLEKVFDTLMSELRDKNGDARLSCAETLGVISEKLNEKQLKNAINTLIDGLKDNNQYVRNLYAKSLGVISTNLTDEQLEGVFNALPIEQRWDYFNSYEKALKEISTKWNEKQSERVFNALMFVSKHSMNTNDDNDKDESLVKLLKLILTKLNDKQLYLLVIHSLERAKKRRIYYRDALSKISEDMWKRATIGGLKEHNIWQILSSNSNKPIELLAFGLMTFNPRIQLNCNDDNITSDDLNELINQIEQVSNDENAFKECYTVVHEAAKSGNLSKFKSILQNHSNIDINDSCNEHRQTPLHLAINHQHWDIARYCIEQGAYIDIKDGA